MMARSECIIAIVFCWFVMMMMMMIVRKLFNDGDGDGACVMMKAFFAHLDRR